MAGKPTVFIGSSVAGMKVARAVEDNLTHNADACRWDHTFGPGSANLENLTRMVDTVDFAAVVLSPDDLTIVNGVNDPDGRPRLNTPRDNVVFELGLFMGRLGRDRTFAVVQRGNDLKIPTDLAGVTLADYPSTHSMNNLRMQVSTACNRIIEAVEKYGRFDHGRRPSSPRQSDLAALDGNWRIDSIVGRETVVIVVGSNPFCELVDRPTAEWLRDEIDRRGGGKKFRRAIILSSDFWMMLKPTATLLKQPVISVGNNPVSTKVTVACGDGSGTGPWDQSPGKAAIQNATSDAGVRVAVWGEKWADTPASVESWVTNPRGLTKFLRDHAGWG